MRSQKRQNDLRFQGKPFNTLEIQVYAPASNTEEAEVDYKGTPLQYSCLKNPMDGGAW